MNCKQTLEAIEHNIVYVKEISLDEMPDDLREAAGDQKTYFSVHDADGARLALVANRKLAFHLARENEMVPMAVH